MSKPSVTVFGTVVPSSDASIVRPAVPGAGPVLWLTTPPCSRCGDSSCVELPYTDVDRFLGQRVPLPESGAFPYLDAEHRELLLTGRHPGCAGHGAAVRQCGSECAGQVLGRSSVRAACTRPAGHTGVHQLWNNRFRLSWRPDGSGSGGALRPQDDDYGYDDVFACTRCGALEEHRDDITLVREHVYCFDCYLWDQRARERTDRQFVVDGVFYSAGTRPASRGRLNGCGGRRFELTTHSGATVVTYDLWVGGSVPSQWWDEFPDDAVFSAGSPPVAGGR